MHQIPNEDTCPDEHTYSLVTYLRSGPATIGTFCTGGTITSIMVLYKARMTLQVPGNRKLEPVAFKLSNGPEISSKSAYVCDSRMNILVFYGFTCNVLFAPSSGGLGESQSAARRLQHQFHHSQLSQRFPGQAAGGMGLLSAGNAQLHGAFSGAQSSRVPQRDSGGGVPQKGQEGDQAGPDGPAARTPTGQLQHGAEELRHQHHAPGAQVELPSVSNEERSSRYPEKSEESGSFWAFNAEISEVIKKMEKLQVAL